MRVWRQHWGVWLVGIVACAAGGLGHIGGAGAQEGKVPSLKGDKDPRKIKPTTVTDDGLGIAPAAYVKDDREKVAPDPIDKPLGKSAPNPFAAQTDELWRCRYTVAAAEHKSPAKVRAGKLALRFTVDVAGSAVKPVVIALEPSDPDVLLCVKREIERWRLLPAPQQPIPVEADVSMALHDARENEPKSATIVDVAKR